MVDQNASCAKEQAKRHNQPKSDVHGSLAPREEVEEARWVVAAVAVVAAPSVEEKREDAAKVIQKHIRGALARMASKQWTGKRRTVTLLKRLSEAAQRLEAVECSFTEAELRQLSADVTTLVALLKVCALSGDCMSARHFTWALDQMSQEAVPVAVLIMLICAMRGAGDAGAGGFDPRTWWHGCYGRVLQGQASSCTIES